MERVAGLQHGSPGLVHMLPLPQTSLAFDRVGVFVLAQNGL